MKRLGLSIFIVIFIATGSAFAQEVKTIKGEVLDLSCYVAEGARGADHETCAVACIKAGEPAGILDEQSGKVYLVVTGDHSNPAIKILPYVAKMVEATGTVHERNGISTIDIQTIKETPSAAEVTQGATK